ncbi:hypothetical protein TNCV_151741 [Trichonephila clavipes]|uniref:Uncharacterized protein n=1 Tax=Trichonephila clavipes TaxID=2585209 RepID=A0A8X6RE74_TRICX|nr:hypothetical protein TNCV_151741 [Trichonephila clavipes]
MPLSRMENTTFAMPSIIDSHDMGLRTVYSPDAQKKTSIQRLFKCCWKKHQDGRIRVWRHPGEHTLTACIRHHHPGSSPGVMLWGAIGCMSWSPLAIIDGTLNSHNARPHNADVICTILNTENVHMVPWPTRSPYRSPIENVWPMVAE